ncbi:cysteine desulfurase-like protein [Anaeromicrobium sediminis]|nr:cysteine desulfurase-like protein [Anaeromicrobium sediminis]
MEFRFDVHKIRKEFPSTNKKVNGNPVAILDGPGGSQVPKMVVEKINDYMFNHNANEHGQFEPSKKTEELIMEGRAVLGQFLGCSKDEIAFGPSSTNNNFMLALAIGRDLEEGDEIIITDMDHTCNRSPWLMLEERGAVVKSVRVDPNTCLLDEEDFKNKLSNKTKVVALNYASNAVGTITDVKKLIKMAHEVGALTVVDAVHYAPHKPIDVKDIDTDFLLCSAYKFFGPHLGVLYAKKEVMEKIRTIRVMADDIEEPPYKFQTGTPCYELICGAAKAVKFISWIGKDYEEYFKSELEGLLGKRRSIVAGMLAIDKYEEELAEYLRCELEKINGVTLYGAPANHPKTSTVSFTHDKINSMEICEELAEEGIYGWNGDFYAIKLVNDVLGLTDRRGLVRIGFAPYNTMDDVKRTVKVLKDILE